MRLSVADWHGLHQSGQHQAASTRHQAPSSQHQAPSTPFRKPCLLLTDGGGAASVVHKLTLPLATLAMVPAPSERSRGKPQHQTQGQARPIWSRLARRIPSEVGMAFVAGALLCFALFCFALLALLLLASTRWVCVPCIAGSLLPCLALPCLPLPTVA
jgi:hypothetical protein